MTTLFVDSPIGFARGFDRKAPDTAHLFFAHHSPIARPMDPQVYWLLEFDIKADHKDFLALIEEMTASAKAEEHTLAYEWSVVEGNRHGLLVERYRDSDAVLVHMKKFGEVFAARFMAAVQPTSFVVFGRPDDRVKAIFAPLNATYRTPIMGFSR